MLGQDVLFIFYMSLHILDYVHFSQVVCIVLNVMF